MTLPRTAIDRRQGALTDGRKDPKSREVSLPPLFVKLAERGYYGAKYAQARIRVRKGCYQYLVWRDGSATREFYLGKRENSTPQKSAGAGELRSSNQVARRRPLRGTK